MQSTGEEAIDTPKQQPLRSPRALTTSGADVECGSHTNASFGFRGRSASEPATGLSGRAPDANSPTLELSSVPTAALLASPPCTKSGTPRPLSVSAVRSLGFNSPALSPQGQPNGSLLGIESINHESGTSSVALIFSDIEPLRNTQVILPPALGRQLHTVSHANNTSAANDTQPGDDESHTRQSSSESGHNVNDPGVHAACLVPNPPSGLPTSPVNGLTSPNAGGARRRYSLQHPHGLESSQSGTDNEAAALPASPSDAYSSGLVRRSPNGASPSGPPGPIRGGSFIRKSSSSSSYVQSNGGNLTSVSTPCQGDPLKPLRSDLGATSPSSPVSVFDDSGRSSLYISSLLERHGLPFDDLARCPPSEVRRRSEQWLRSSSITEPKSPNQTQGALVELAVDAITAFFCLRQEHHRASIQPLAPQCIAHVPFHTPAVTLPTAVVKLHGQSSSRLGQSTLNEGTDPNDESGIGLLTSSTSYDMHHRYSTDSQRSVVTMAHSGRVRASSVAIGIAPHPDRPLTSGVMVPNIEVQPHTPATTPAAHATVTLSPLGGGALSFSQSPKHSGEGSMLHDSRNSLQPAAETNSDGPFSTSQTVAALHLNSSSRFADASTMTDGAEHLLAPPRPEEGQTDDALVQTSPWLLSSVVLPKAPEETEEASTSLADVTRGVRRNSATLSSGGNETVPPYSPVKSQGVTPASVSTQEYASIPEGSPALCPQVLPCTCSQSSEVPVPPAHGSSSRVARSHGPVDAEVLRLPPPLCETGSEFVPPPPMQVADGRPTVSPPSAVSMSLSVVGGSAAGTLLLTAMPRRVVASPSHSPTTACCNEGPLGREGFCPLDGELSGTSSGSCPAGERRGGDPALFDFVSEANGNGIRSNATSFRLQPSCSLTSAPFCFTSEGHPQSRKDNTAVKLANEFLSLTGLPIPAKQRRSSTAACIADVDEPMATDVSRFVAGTERRLSHRAPSSRQMTNGMMPPCESMDVLDGSLTSVGSLRIHQRAVVTKTAQLQSDEFGMLTLNDYLITERLGQGNFGVVFLAHRLADNERVAIKCVRMRRFIGAAPRSHRQKAAFTASAMAKCDDSPASPVISQTTSTSGMAALAHPNTTETESVSGIMDGASALASRTNSFQNLAPKLSPETPMTVGVGGGNGVSEYLETFAIDPRLPVEVAIMKQVNNKHIVRMYEAILDPGRKMVYLVMQYVDGGCVLRKVASASHAQTHSENATTLGGGGGGYASPFFGVTHADGGGGGPPPVAFGEGVVDGSSCSTLSAASPSHQTLQLTWNEMASHGHVVYHRLPRRQILRYLRQMASALAYLHAKGILHRDIKPENILVDTSCQHAYLADFGVSEMCVEGDSGDVAPVLIGTPFFMAPELFRHGEGVALTPAVDVWALGVTVYAMATGRLPFYGVTRDEVASKVMTHEPEYPVDPGEDPVDDDLKFLIRLMLKKEPKHRITIDSLLGHRHLMIRRKTAAGHPAAISPHPHPQTPETTQQPPSPAAACVTLLSAVAAAAVSNTQIIGDDASPHAAGTADSRRRKSGVVVFGSDHHDGDDANAHTPSRRLVGGAAAAIAAANAALASSAPSTFSSDMDTIPSEVTNEIIADIVDEMAHLTGSFAGPGFSLPMRSTSTTPTQREPSSADSQHHSHNEDASRPSSMYRMAVHRGSQHTVAGVNDVLDEDMEDHDDDVGDDGVLDDGLQDGGGGVEEEDADDEREFPTSVHAHSSGKEHRVTRKGHADDQHGDDSSSRHPKPPHTAPFDLSEEQLQAAFRIVVPVEYTSKPVMSMSASPITGHINYELAE